MRLFVLVRHGQSELNVTHRVNGDPTVAVALSVHGEEESRRLGVTLAGVELDLCVHTRFARTRQTATLALAGREVPLLEEPLLDDVDVGELEGRSIEDYRGWKRNHPRSEAFPGGESLDAAALRYAAAFRRLLTGHAQCALVVCHEIPVRYAVNAAAGSIELDGPTHDIANATPYLFDEAGLLRAAEGIERAVSRKGGSGLAARPPRRSLARLRDDPDVRLR
jgi:broad specificity phosphatase PhoE